MPKSAQLNFDFLLGDRQQFRVKEVADIIGLSEDFVEKLYDQGVLYGHEHNAATAAERRRRKRGRSRKTKTVLRESIVCYLITTATYDLHTRLEAFQRIVDTLSRTELQELSHIVLKKLGC